MTAGSDYGADDELLVQLLVIRCQAGDDAALARLVERFGPRTLRYLTALVGDDAEDVHQDVWLGVHRRIAQLTHPGAFVGWLFQLARHRAVDWLRRRRRERELMDDLALLAAMDDAADTGGMPDLGDSAQVASAIAALSPAHREVFLLRYEEEMSYSEIALVVGCSIGTVKSRLHHARRRLAQSLGPHA